MPSPPPEPSGPSGATDQPPGAWPAGCRVSRWVEEAVFVAQFDDAPEFRDRLRARVMALAADPDRATPFGGEIGSVKIYDVDRWGCAEADLIHERALHLFRIVSRKAERAVDLSWASVYHDGDWCMPHSHPRTQASVLYVLDLGERGDKAGGQFCFADPRMKMCCREEPGYVSTPSAPPMTEGTMMLFPGQAIHFVTPYHGSRPRLTMSWNLNHATRPGDPLPKGTRRPKHDRPAGT
ncbi:MAG TPA: putative 2OG-Fe(II) oxygenase [Thermohalobaculum sp.]|nr:putative 2OG-Fe(II) oxygenase [Thermohalobaculum sp.]